MLMPDALQIMTWREFGFLSDGYYRAEQLKWLHTRVIATMIYNQYHKKPLKPAEFMPLPIDEEGEVELVSLEEFENMKKAWRLS